MTHISPNYYPNIILGRYVPGATISPCQPEAENGRAWEILGSLEIGLTMQNTAQSPNQYHSNRQENISKSWPAVTQKVLLTCLKQITRTQISQIPSCHTPTQIPQWPPRARTAIPNPLRWHLSLLKDQVTNPKACRLNRDCKETTLMRRGRGVLGLWQLGTTGPVSCQQGATTSHCLIWFFKRVPNPEVFWIVPNFLKTLVYPKL